MKGWLDNYGEEENANDSKAKGMSGFVGEGYSNKGRNYSPAWGGQFKGGGKLPTGGLSRGKDYGSKSKPYPSVSKGDFAGGGRSYPIPTKEDAGDALRLASLHGRADVKAKVYAKYPELKKDEMGGSIPGSVGFSYARTGAPSNGKYAKKTMPSAQKGGKMKPELKQLMKDVKAQSKYDPVAKEAQSEELRRITSTKEYQDAVKKAKADEAKQIIADRKKRIKESIKARETPYTKENWRQKLADETQATGDKFRIFPDDPDSFIDEWINPGVAIGNMASDLGSAPLRAREEDSYRPYVTSVAAPLVTGALEGIGTGGSNAKFINNMFNPFNMVPGYSSLEKKLATALTDKFGKPAVVSDVAEEALPAMASKTGKGKNKLVKKLAKGTLSALEKAQEFDRAMKDHSTGIVRGLQDKRPFFEKFPLTKAQREKVMAAQDAAFERGTDFTKKWFYDAEGNLRPEVERKMRMLNPEFEEGMIDPVFMSQNKLVGSRRGQIAAEDITDEAKEYLKNERGRIGGVSLGTGENLTLRNRGLYYLDPKLIEDVGTHELAHSAQDIGRGYKRNLRTGEIKQTPKWSESITAYDPSFTKYYYANPDTAVGRFYGEAMRAPKPGGYTWNASPMELHSELMVARKNKAQELMRKGYTEEEAITELMYNPSETQIKEMYDEQKLGQFFKKETPRGVKASLIKHLPAVGATAVGAEAMQGDNEEQPQHKMGGVIKDNRGQWAYPGEITEIGSNDITMQGVPYDVIGISDTGDIKRMKPGKNYKYKGKRVTEFPIGKNGKELTKLDQLTNFTNYNKPQPGGWLDKYQ